MGKVNDQLSYFFNNPNRLADFFNVIVYNGQRVILPQQLADVQRCYQEPLPDRYGKKRASRRERDVAKLLCRNGHPVLLAVENQDQINYCMPLRCAEYDLTDLTRQLRRLKRHYRKTKELKGSAEYLSGMKADDRLIPSVTIVFYHGKGQWTAATQLNELLDLEGADGPLRRFLGNYRLHVVSLEELDENRFETDLREVIGIAKCRGDKKALQAYCEDHADRLRSLSEDTYDLLCTLLNRENLIQKKENYYNEETEDIDMCKAIDDWEKEAMEKGKKEGMREGKKEGIEAGKEAGKKEGIKKGRKEGEEKLGALIQNLSRDNRLDDILKAASSVRARNRLYKEYSL